MKRQEVKDLIRRIHPEGDIGDIVDAIMDLNGADIENAKKNSGLAKAEEERDALRQQLDEYEKPEGSKYIDPKEHERLKKYETDSIAKKKRTSVEKAVKDMLSKHKVVPDVIKLALKGINVDEVALGEDGKVTKEFETAYMDGFKKDYPNSFTVPSPGTGNPAHGGGDEGNGGSGGTDGFDDFRSIN